MAVLSKIRQKSVLLIAVIGIALLAFIIGDLVNSGSLNSGSRNVGSINGVEINTQEFLHKVAQAEQNAQMSNSQANQAVWNQELNSIILTSEFERLGLQIGKDQLINVIKQNQNFANNPQFQNQLGQFDIAKFNEFVLSMKNAGQDQWNSWLNYEKELEKVGLQQMYNALISSGIYTTSAEAKAAYLDENSKVSFDYVTVPFSTINNEEVKVTDDEITAYIKQNENRFKSDYTREIEYAFIDGSPSEADKEAVKERVADLLKPSIVYNATTSTNDTVAGFKSTTSIADFVNTNSDVKFDSLYYTKSDLPLEYQEELFNLNPGEVFGPYYFNDHYCLTRLVSKKPGEKVKAAHILITFEGAQAPQANSRSKEEAKAEADNILKQVQANPEKFGELAMLHSEDPGSKNNAGEYDNIPRGQMVPQFDEFIFNNPAGKLGVVETDFGYHVIKVIEKKEAVQLATIAQKIEISDATGDQIYTQAAKLEQDAASGNLEELATQAKLAFQKEVIIRPFDEQLPVVGSQRNIVSWAFGRDAKIGDIKRFDIANGYIVAKLKAKNDTGLLSATEARATVEPILMDQKKATLIRQKMTASTIEEIASQTGATVASVNEVTRQNPLITNIGQEAKVVATAFATPAGENSKLVDGVKGVYMVKTKSLNQAPELPNYNNYKQKESISSKNGAPSKALNALKNAAKIKDNRVGTVM